MDFEPKDYITLAGIIITFLVGVLNLFNGLFTNKRTVYVNAVTSERVKWMGQLKELLSEYLSITSFYEQKPFLENNELKEYFERLLYLKNRIKLHLNPTDEKDKEIVDLIDKINKKIFSLYDFRKFYLMKDETAEDYIKKLESIPEEIREELFKKLIQKCPVDDINKMLKDEDSILREHFFNLFNEELHEIVKRKFGFKGKDDLVTWSERLTELSSEYLKEEWERVKMEAQNGKPIQGNVIRKNRIKALITIGVFLVIGIFIGIYATEYSMAAISIFFLFLIYSTFLPLLKEILIESITTRLQYSLLIIFSEVPLWISVIVSLNRLLMLFPSEALNNEWIIYSYVIVLLILKVVFSILPKWSVFEK